MNLSREEALDNMSLIPYQYSIKLDTGEIYMVQAESGEELGLAIEELKRKFLPNKEIEEAIKTPQPGLVCQICGSKAEIKEGVSKAGNQYKVFRCLKNPEIQPNGHSRFER